MTKIPADTSDTVQAADAKLFKDVYTRLCVIDLGTNSFHSLIVDIYANGTHRVMDRLKELVTLGAEGLDEGRLSEAAMSRGLSALQRIKLLADGWGAREVVAYATSAIREAHNGGEFIHRVRRETGIRIQPITGPFEAELIYFGVRRAVDLARPSLLVDIGGGSTEFVIADEDTIYQAHSLKLGAARLTGRFFKLADPIPQARQVLLESYLGEQLDELLGLCTRHQVQDVVGSSGTLEALILATTLQSEAGSFSSSGMGVDREALLALVDRLLGMTRAERAAVPGIDAKRADQIVAGALLVRHVLRQIPTIQHIRLSKEALREGMVAHYIGRKSDQIANLGRIGGVRRRSVFEMAIRYDWDEVHAQQVANFALELFDELKMLHDLGDRERELLEYAGLLHDVGYHISRSGHHKHALYLIQNGELRGFSPEEVQIIAHVARYHRKSLPKPTHASFYEMSASAQHITLHLAAMLRIAEGLDRSRFQHVHIVSVTIDRADIHIRIKGVHDVQLDIWGALRWKDLIEELYKRSLHVEQSRG